MTGANTSPMRPADAVMAPRSLDLGPHPSGTAVRIPKGFRAGLDATVAARFSMHRLARARRTRMGRAILPFCVARE